MLKSTNIVLQVADIGCFLYDTLDYQHCCIHLADCWYWFLRQSTEYCKMAALWTVSSSCTCLVWMVTKIEVLHSVRKMLNSATECCEQFIYITS